MSSENPVCVANIGPKEQRKRQVMGMVLFAMSAGILAVTLALGTNRWWRLGLFLPYWMAATGFFQAKEKT